ncbi:DUF3558 family protein [Kibdelosporangium aridum]|uniref:DUF3558 family protein n=1 Tax=Kibdelosporangium aridum TaxID=2030 RepID=UPI001F2D814B|nr:DUF3558 family protein [Kibdelosporangium aridum]
MACTSEIPGTPTPGNQPSATSRATIPGGGGTSGTPSGTNNPGANASPIKGLDPCTLLSADEASAFGAAAGTRKDGLSDAVRGCRWTASGQYSIQVDLFDENGINDVEATGEKKPVPTVGKHQAIQFLYGPSCTISLAINETSRVDVAVASGNDTTKACGIAMQVAQKVEPKLPGS